MKLLLIVALQLAPVAIAAAPDPVVKAPQVDSPTRMLFVGNSYFYYGDSLHNHVQRLVVAAYPKTEGKLNYKSATIGGSVLAHHNIDHLTQHGQIGVKEPFQLVILQGGSGEPLSEARRAKFREKAVEFSKVIAARGGTTALYRADRHLPRGLHRLCQRLRQVAGRERVRLLWQDRQRDRRISAAGGGRHGEEVLRSVGKLR